MEYLFILPSYKVIIICLSIYLFRIIAGNAWLI